MKFNSKNNTNEENVFKKYILTVLKIIKSNYLITILVIMFLGFGIYTIFSAYHRPIWDETVYLGMGKYIATGGNIGLFEVIRPIILPIILSIGYLFSITVLNLNINVLNLNLIIFGQLISLIASSISIILTYLIALKIFNNEKNLSNNKIIYATLSALFVAMTPIFFYESIMIMTESLCLMFILWTIYLIINEKYFFGGIMLGIAFLTKFPSIIILIPILTYILISQNNVKEAFTIKDTSKTNKNIKKYLKNIALIILGIVIITIPYFIYNVIKYTPDRKSTRLNSSH